MNFYASRGFLDAAAAVYFKDRDANIENVRIGNDVLRLLVVDGKTIITSLQFLDLHQPLKSNEIDGPVRQGRYARFVVCNTISARAWDPLRYPDKELAPYVDWSSFTGFDDFKSQLVERQRGLVRDRERRGRSLASKYGELTFTADDRAEDVFRLAQQWKSRQLRDTGLKDYFTDPRAMVFLNTLQERGLLMSSTLRAGGRLVSVWIGFIHDGCWSGWIFTYDPEFRKFSAGHQLLIRMLEESCRLGHREFDFSDGAHDYKMFYATHGRLLGDIGKPTFSRAMAHSAKKVLQSCCPVLFEKMRSAKRSVNIAVTQAAFERSV
jgi:hypothetical protein